MSADSHSLSIDPVLGLARGVPFLASPHCDERPPGCAVELLVIHAISLPAGRYGGDDVAALFLGQLDCRRPDYAGLAGLRVSAHFFIRRDGRLVQFVPIQRRAWHAGASRFGQRERCNDFSVGVELEGCDHDPFSADQYTTLIALTRALRAACPAISADRIVGHSDIAPGRKTDPGPHFDWARYRAGLLHTP
ncbi:MAG TPA: 1,6-anhydro-N-acetylmuramyl-L-alanine amidase AmpD [Gammaproteobacteria bacterium]|uniref:1,6-anhydro-N-acetylmuramyl-L-alanine amidase AmpD n=1 Tax=Immundisolibacter sp. TaxID=1934948 RepID=UPI000E9BF050|nr:1,6-anhydro-N-acetylmuramyl-L-alanine amidase AmpD [Gammaproteobacteria bacterium]HCZ49235.1 1,6-anhydro-N-acetylmuramyl-L-alanine amidase AmpD [Gammaproteobacteria bacterium]MCH78673.1 1,6-anhydro-N-acetylmuramyl-L-alanine amidase AmpD [Gammaproteobacteria bacterium]